MRTSILKTDLPVVDATARVGVQTPHRSPPGSLPQLLLLETAYDLAARSYEVLRVPSKWFKSTTRHFARPVAITPQGVEPVSLTLWLAGTRPSFSVVRPSSYSVNVRRCQPLRWLLTRLRTTHLTQSPKRPSSSLGATGLAMMPLCAPRGNKQTVGSLIVSPLPSQGVHSLVAGDRHPPDHAAPYPHTGGPPQWHLSTGRSWGIPFYE